ncbi:MAG: hypothetical protein ABI763_16340 [Bacteroidota bacterium]
MSVAILILILGPRLFRRYVKLNGIAFINDNSLKLILNNFDAIIQFDNIKSYQVVIFIGVALKLQLKDGRKLNLVANSNFCNSEQFGFFCDELEQALELSQATKEKSFFEKRGNFYFLVTMTLLIVAAVIFAVVVSKRTPSAIFMSAFALATLWGGYYNTMKRNRRKVNQKD